MPDRRSSRQKQRTVAIGLTRNDLTVLVLDDSGTGESARVRHRRLRWRENAPGLHDPEGLAELTAALSRLAAEEKLQRDRIQVALSSDFCVTRVISGENEAVQRELSEVIERSRGYLSLGLGEKVAAVSTSPIDARRRHVWLTVATRPVLEHLEAAFAAARLRLVRVEHSLVALSRVMEATGDDADAPAVIIDVAETGVDVAITFRGQLLLDYRPSGANTKDSIGVIVARHTKRLQRYIDRLLKAASARIGCICLCGETSDIGRIQEQLAGHSDIPVRLLDPGSVPTGWTLDESVRQDHSLTADLGILLEQTAGGRTEQYPNLLAPLRQSKQRPVLRSLIQLGWPIAATLTASLLLTVSAWYEKLEAQRLEQAVAVHADDLIEVENLRREAVAVHSRVRHLGRIHQQLRMPAWTELVTHTGQCLPRGVWLSSLHVDRVGTVTIHGNSRAEDAVFEFVRHLRHVPHLSGAALESTQQVVTGAGPAVRFTVRAVSRLSEREMFAEPGGETSPALSQIPPGRSSLR